MASFLPECVRDIRAFNRFYTRQLGLLRQGHLGTRFSLTEVRVLFELHRHPQRTATEIGAELGLDAGYLSRILGRFARQRLLVRRRSARDGRQAELRITPRGRKIFAGLDAKATEHIGGIIGHLPPDLQRELAVSLGRARELLSLEPGPPAPVTLCSPRSGDLGWVVMRHGAVAGEFGWGAWFEALVARIVADFAASFDPKRERCWIADLGGRPCGCVFLVRATDEVAKLRLLMVEPSARGRGVGSQLVEACIAFARSAGYSRLALWTTGMLQPARHLYEKAGFRLVASQPEPKFGPGQVAETWELSLAPASP